MRAARLVTFVGGAPGIRYRRVTFQACALHLAAGCVAYGHGLVTRSAIPIALLAYALQLASRCVALGHGLVTRSAIPIALLAYALQLASRCVALDHGPVTRSAIPIAVGCHRIPKLKCPVAFVGQTFTPGSVLGMLLEQAVAFCARLITRLNQLGALG